MSPLRRLSERFVTRLAERHVTRQRARRSRWLRTGRRDRHTDRALHNDFDYACRYWWGDRHPERNDTSNRELSGQATGIDDRRCLVCRPYDVDEERLLLGW